MNRSVEFWAQQATRADYEAVIAAARRARDVEVARRCHAFGRWLTGWLSRSPDELDAASWAEQQSNLKASGH
ncbi:MAG: hypothetical protein GC191_02925 [Azospirillum sp.]|nr:hypothetical protein [Azospirillum sp.]